MASVSPLRSKSTPLTGPRTTETPGASFSTGTDAACPATQSAATTPILLTQPGFISLQYGLSFVYGRAAGCFFVFGMESKHHLDRAVDFPRCELGDPLYRTARGSADLRFGVGVRQAQCGTFAGEALDADGFRLRLQLANFVTRRLIAGEHDHRNVKVTCHRGYLPDLADGAAVDRDSLHRETLRMREHPAFGAGHGVLSDEEDTVVGAVGKVVVRRCRSALDQFRSRVDLVDGETAAAVVAVPYDDLRGPRREGTLDGCVQFTGEQMA